ncbi:MAG: hypothetical protein AB4290_00935 [Spirulina sp.]
MLPSVIFNSYIVFCYPKEEGINVMKVAGLYRGSLDPDSNLEVSHEQDLLEIIRIAADRLEMSLDLGCKQLSELPPEIGQLVSLQSLYLSGNQLHTLPPEIKKFLRNPEDAAKKIPRYFRRELDKIHATYKRLQYKTLVPCNCKTCNNSQEPHFYTYDKLVEKMINGKPTDTCDKKPYLEVKIAGLIGDIEASTETITRLETQNREHISPQDLKEILASLKQQIIIYNETTAQSKAMSNYSKSI